MKQIRIRGARTHNLKNLNIDFPRDKLIVITGLSGSGKSSLAFDTLYAEGQRRYVESLSAYARQFLSMMEKPDVDHIEGLSPAISIEQKSTSHNPRSTVGTITEIHDYLRLLFAKVGQPHCPLHGNALEAQTVSQMVDMVLSLPIDTKIMILAPVVRERKGEHVELLQTLRTQGFVRARIDGEMEGYKVGKVVEVYRIFGVQILGKNRYQYCLNEGEWISESECFNLAAKGKVELEICISKLSNKFLRTPPNSLFQKRLEDLICKK